MASLNKILLIGNLTRDPQLSYLPSQTAVVEFGLAMNRRWTGKDGEKREDTCFVDCRAFGKTAETINKYLAKGRSVFVEGRLDFETWTASDGAKRSKHKVTVEKFQFVDSGRSAGEAGQGGQQAEPQAGPAGQQAAPQAGPEHSDNHPVDDIPF